MTGKKICPPRAAERIMGWLIGGDTAYGALGDMEENFFDIMSRKGIRSARRYYWSQVLSAIPGSLFNRFCWSLEMSRNYAKITVRNIVRHKAFSLINIAGLAIGIASCILILLWVQDEAGYDRMLPNSDNIYRVYRQFDTPDGIRFSTVNPAGLGPLLKNDYAGITDAARYMVHDFSLKSGEKRFTEKVALADLSIFDIFSLEFVRGDKETAFSDLRNIILTEELAEKYFGDEDPVGKTLQVETWYEASVVGVVKALPERSTPRKFGAVINFDIYAPLWGRDLTDMKVGNYLTYVQLHPDTDPEKVGENIENALLPFLGERIATDQKANPGKKIGISVVLHPLIRERLHKIEGGGLITYVYIFSSIGLFILVIACFNYMNLATARSMKRAVEVGVRRVIGANRPQLTRQFFGEAILMAMLSVIIAAILVYLLIPSFNQLADKDISLSPSHGLILTFLAFGLVAGILSGSYPAIVLSRVKPATVMKRALNKTMGVSWFRRTLVTAQFSISIFLIIASIVIFRQIDFIRSMDLGYRTENIIDFTLSSGLQKQFDSLRSTLMQNPDITGVTRVNAPPVYNESSAGNVDVSWEGKTESDYIASFHIMGAGLDFDKIFEPRLISGRLFSVDHPSDMQDGAILNETAVKMMGIEDPVGKTFSVWDFSGHIIGVIRDFHIQSLHDQIAPLVILPNWGIDNICIGLKGENTEETLAFIEKTVETFEPGYVMEYKFLTDMIAENYAVEQRIDTIIRYGTALAIFISCLGLLGLAAYTAEQRTQEIGIRKILGSSISGIVILLTREFFKWILIANIIAWPLAWYASRKWLERFAYKTSIGIDIFLIAGFSALLIAALSVGWQAFRAARCNPIDSLRYE